MFRFATLATLVLFSLSMARADEIDDYQQSVSDARTDTTAMLRGLGLAVGVSLFIALCLWVWLTRREVRCRDDHRHQQDYRRRHPATGALVRAETWHSSNLVDRHSAINAALDATDVVCVGSGWNPHDRHRAGPIRTQWGSRLGTSSLFQPLPKWNGRRLLSETPALLAFGPKDA